MFGIGWVDAGWLADGGQRQELPAAYLRGTRRHNKLLNYLNLNLQTFVQAVAVVVKHIRNTATVWWWPSHCAEHSLSSVRLSGRRQSI